MPQVFNRNANTAARLSILGVVIILGLVSWALYSIGFSDYATQAFTAREQPVMFSHKHHVGDDGIDCRYCHTSVETSAFAGIPPTKTCMNCHRQIWANSPMLQPVRDSFRTGQPLKWTRVHDLPDFVYFNHSIHVNKGVGCSTCHGQVDKMSLTYQVNSLYMQWCLQCHRNPELYVRPKDKVFDMKWPADADPKFDQAVDGPRLVKENKILSPAV
ncbi:MAG: cytochrome c3 family protein, partial [Blastocatellia bacterium]